MNLFISQERKIDDSKEEKSKDTPLHHLFTFTIPFSNVFLITAVHRINSLDTDTHIDEYLAKKWATIFLIVIRVPLNVKTDMRNLPTLFLFKKSGIVK